MELLRTDTLTVSMLNINAKIICTSSGQISVKNTCWLMTLVAS